MMGEMRGDEEEEEGRGREGPDARLAWSLWKVWSVPFRQFHTNDSVKNEAMGVP